MDWTTLDLSIKSLLKCYRNNEFTPEALCSYLRHKSEEYKNYNCWIHLLSEDELNPYLQRLQQRSIADCPLYGIPFAIKDNIDLAEIPTTAACQEFAYTPGQHAFVVRCLIDAGAIPLGKTNLDQFATGLVGTRSPEPWGPCRNAYNPDYISGGSSSGSAVAVALGLVSFALGTDTAGSGRVPAALQNLYGLKPSKGLLSTSGVVPACRSLDCVSIFSLTPEDANTVFEIAATYDEQDTYARPNKIKAKDCLDKKITLGVPSELEFFDSQECETLWNQAVDDWKSMGAEIVEIDFEPFKQAARLLYEGPWLAERYIATESVIKTKPEAMHPIVRSIIEKGSKGSAIECFTAEYQLQAYKKEADKELAKVDCLLTPTIGKSYTIKEVLADPVTLNSQLGYYTNYMNLLDYAAIAIPAGKTEADVPWGCTLVASAFEDQKLLTLADEWWQFKTTGETSFKLSIKTQKNDEEFTDIAVCGAHLEGQPLNWQLTERGATLVKKCKSADNYRLYALPDGKRPALVRVSEQGVAIEIELWRLPTANLGGFVATISAPLGVGKVETEDNEWVSGFICEQGGIDQAQDISKYGGWRKYIGSPVK